MSESAEHAFLKQVIIEVLEEFSHLRLYGLTEAARRRFDFSCRLERDWSRLLTGQAVWRHGDGIEKDVRTLLTDTESEIKAYVACDTLAYRRLLDETVSDYRHLTTIEPFRFKVFWVPSDFDADDELDRSFVREKLKAEIVEDILFKVLFGEIDAQSLQPLLDTTGRLDVILALLVCIAEHGMDGLAMPAAMLGVSSNTVERRRVALHTAGLIRGLERTLVAEISPRGRAVLDILARLDQERTSGTLTPELTYILDRLGCPVVKEESNPGRPDGYPHAPFVRLIQVLDATKAAGVHLDDLRYTTIDEQGLVPPGWESSRSTSTSGRPR
jgi:hypothetical protein